MTDQREEILAGLAPLFECARTDGLWFHCSYQDMWFTPDELAKKHADGHFIWGAVNWTLRDPAEKLEQLHAHIEAARAELARFEQRMRA